MGTDICFISRFCGLISKSICILLSAKNVCWQVSPFVSSKASVLSRFKTDAFQYLNNGGIYMNKLFFRKQLAVFMAVALVCLSCLTERPAQAAFESYTPFLNDTGNAAAYQVLNLDISMLQSSAAKIGVVVPSPVGMSVTLFKSDGVTMLYRDEVTSQDGWVYDSSVQGYPYVLDLSAPTLGRYVLTLCFDTDTAYTVIGVQDGDYPSGLPVEKPTAAPSEPLVPGTPSVPLSISSKSLKLTEGFASKLSASGGTGTVKWSSSKPSVASVNSKGKVTAKNAGSAIITASSQDGSKATCKVTVKVNVYLKKATLANDIPYGRAVLDIYRVSYNSKGDLVVKVNFLNNCGRTVTELRDIKVTVKDGSGHVIGTYFKKKKSVSVFSPGGKGFKFVVKKSKLKQKSVKDLRKATVKAKGNYYYEWRRY